MLFKNHQWLKRIANQLPKCFIKAILRKWLCSEQYVRLTDEKKNLKEHFTHVAALAMQMFMISRLQERVGQLRGIMFVAGGKKTSSTHHFQTKWSQTHFQKVFKKPLQCTSLVKTWQTVLDSAVCFLQRLMWTEIQAQITSTCANLTQAFVFHSFSLKRKVADVQICYNCMSKIWFYQWVLGNKIH